MELPIFLSFVICGLQLLKLATGDVLYLDDEFCYLSEDYVTIICRHIDSRNYSGVEYQYKEASYHYGGISYLYFEQSPYMAVIPKKLPGVTRLKITQTQLQNITSTDLPRNRLEELDLSSNNISFVSEGAFENMTNLWKLDLSRNALQSLPADIFLGSSISTLDVSYNKLTDDLEFLQELWRLTSLDMSGNSIGHISSRMIAKNRELKYLSLAHNRIDRLEYGSFPYNSLQKLDLSHNNLYSINHNIFVTVPQLSKLYLNGTQIRLPAITFLIRTVNLEEIEIPSNYYRCDDLVEVVKEMRERQINLKVPNPNYETPNINGLQCLF